MKSGIDSLSSYAAWEDLYSQLTPELASPFFSRAYLCAFQQAEESPVECFWQIQDEHNFLFYPYLKKSINALGYQLAQEHYDVSGAYGYNGPMGRVSDQTFLAGFNAALLDYFKQNNVVTEFVRYCPVSENRRYHLYTEQIDVLDNVFIDISSGLDQVWTASFEHGVRKAIKRGESYGLTTRIQRGEEITSRDLQVFFDIYNSTMNRNSADQFYYFSLDFFAAIIEQLGDMAVLVTTYFEDRATTTELILVGGELAFGFLGGTLAEYYQYKANTFQRWEVLKYLEACGVKKYSMGGGASRGDNIYKFKLSFARECVNPFFIGTKVHLPDVYADIRRQWQELFPEAVRQYASRLQGYRITR